MQLEFEYGILASTQVQKTNMYMLQRYLARI